MNSNWTMNHINHIWNQSKRTHLLYPPCNTESLAQIDLNTTARQPLIISIGQFRFAKSFISQNKTNSRFGTISFVTFFFFFEKRPEKNHSLQLEAFKQFVSQNRHLIDSIERQQPEKVKLVLIGGSRNEEDQARIKNLQRKAVEFKLEDRVEFKVNISRDELIKYLSKATIGVHTMFNEHFGIGVVEFMVCEILFDYFFFL